MLNLTLPTRGLSLLLSCALAFAAASCGVHHEGASSSASASAALPESFALSAAPAGATTVLAARASTPSGQRVALSGRAKDFVDGRAVFTLIDASIPSCLDMDVKDHCKTPWDYCCQDQGDVARASATIEFRQDGKPLKASLKGFHGLDHLAQVVVTGTLAKDEAGNLSLDADGLYVAH